MKRTPEEILEAMDAILDEYEGAKDRYDRNQFSESYGDRLGAYSDKLKALNGDDFDIVSAAYDEHKNDYSDLSDDEYVDALEENIKSVIARIWPEASEEEVEEAAAEIKEEVAAESEEEEPAEEDPELVTSDQNTKQVPSGKKDDGLTTETDFSLIKERGDGATGKGNGWGGSPHTSGGRNGHTSDEECKEEAEEKIEAVTDVAKEALPKGAQVAIEVATAKPEDVEPKDELDDFTKALEADLPKYKRGR